MSKEKCFCHLTDKVTGEKYVVKDKEAREWIDAMTQQRIGDRAVPTVTPYASSPLDVRMIAASTGLLSGNETIIMRDANGRAQIADPSQSSDIVNKKYVDQRVKKYYLHTVDISTSTAYAAQIGIDIVIRLKLLSSSGDPFTAYSLLYNNVNIVDGEGYYIYPNNDGANNKLYHCYLIEISGNALKFKQYKPETFKFVAHEISYNALNNSYLFSDTVTEV